MFFKYCEEFKGVEGMVLLLPVSTADGALEALSLLNLLEDKLSLLLTNVPRDRKELPPRAI